MIRCSLVWIGLKRSMAEELYYVRTPIGRLPLDLVCLSNGNISLVRSRLYPAQDIVDFSAEGVLASIGDDVMILATTDSNVVTIQEEHNLGEQIEYKQYPYLLKWLQAQNLPNPLEKND